MQYPGLQLCYEWAKTAGRSVNFEREGEPPYLYFRHTTEGVEFDVLCYEYQKEVVTIHWQYLVPDNVGIDILASRLRTTLVRYGVADRLVYGGTEGRLGFMELSAIWPSVDKSSVRTSNQFGQLVDAAARMFAYVVIGQNGLH